MWHCIVKNHQARREIVVFSARQDDGIILDLDVTDFVSKDKGYFVNLYTQVVSKKVDKEKRPSSWTVCATD